jgi:hypothetical protein
MLNQRIFGKTGSLTIIIKIFKKNIRKYLVVSTKHPNFALSIKNGTDKPQNIH